MKIRQNTRLTAFEMFRRGFSVSDAALHVNQNGLQVKGVQNELSHRSKLHP
jgi:hypothetical protein